MAVAGDSPPATVAAASSLAFLLLSLLISIPVGSFIAFVPSPRLRHVFCLIAGMLLFWLAYGQEAIVVFTVSSLTAYVALSIIPRKHCGIITFIGAFSGLLFWHVRSFSSDIWRQGGIDYGGAMMIATLKYVSAAMDYQDGAGSGRDQPPSKSPNSLHRLPSLLEYFSFVFFPAAVLVGPVFSLRPYLAFIQGDQLWTNFYQLPLELVATDATKVINGPQSDDTGTSAAGGGGGASGGASASVGADRIAGAGTSAGTGAVSSTHTSTSSSSSPAAPSSKQATINPEAADGVAAGGMPRPFPPRLPAVGRALLQAGVCLGVCLLLKQRVTTEFLYDPAYFRMGFLSRLLYAFAALKATTWTFYFTWSVTEAAMIASGFGFTGWKPATASVHTHAAAAAANGGGGGADTATSALELVPDWSRAVSAQVLALELTANPAQMPVLWNMSVSNWLRIYVYDRLTVSLQSSGLLTLVLTQVVSALWHGLHPGYYLFFVSAATIQQASRGLYKLEQAMLPKRVYAWRILRALHFLFGQLVLSYGPLGFILLRADRTLAVWKSLYYCGTIAPLALMIFFKIFPIKGKKHKTN